MPSSFLYDVAIHSLASTATRRVETVYTCGVMAIRALIRRVIRFWTRHAHHAQTHPWRDPMVLYACAILVLPVCVATAQTRVESQSRQQQDNLQADYEEAQNFQSAGNLREAELRYKAFLTTALDHLAMDFSYIGAYAEAKPLFEEARRIRPDDKAIALDYAEAAFMAADMPQAQSLAEQVLLSEPNDPSAHRILGQTFLAENHKRKSKDELEAAVALDPTYENGYALATTDLALKDKDAAAQLFSEMLAGFGDSAKLHMDFGRAYAVGGYPEEAIDEFRKAIAEDDKLPGAHYSLGASYILSMGEINFPLAKEEFEKELQISPNDFLSYSQLGYIALSQHQFPEAEHDLTRAAALNPQDPDVYLSLGQLYMQMNRPADAESALRKSIELTTNPARNHYQVQRAHYLLGRLLLQSKRSEEGRKQIEISDSLLKLSVLQNQGKPDGAGTGNPVPAHPWKTTEVLTNPAALAKVQEYEHKIAPALADSYNNLGVILASNKQFADALKYFQEASDWNPHLDDLDSNLGRAAFETHKYDVAVPHLTSYLTEHPGDLQARSELALSLYAANRYADVIKTLAPLVKTIYKSPELAYINAQSLIKSGQYQQGILLLQTLEKDNVRSSRIHRALGEALIDHGDYSTGEHEIQKSLALDPKDIHAKYDMARALTKLRRFPEALQAWKDVSLGMPGNAEVYYQIGEVEFQLGNVVASVASLRTAANISPMNSQIRNELVRISSQSVTGIKSTVKK